MHRHTQATVCLGTGRYAEQSLFVLSLHTHHTLPVYLAHVGSALPVCSVQYSFAVSNAARVYVRTTHNRNVQTFHVFCFPHFSSFSLFLFPLDPFLSSFPAFTQVDPPCITQAKVSTGCGCVQRGQENQIRSQDLRLCTGCGKTFHLARGS